MRQQSPRTIFYRGKKYKYETEKSEASYPSNKYNNDHIDKNDCYEYQTSQF